MKQGPDNNPLRPSDEALLHILDTADRGSLSKVCPSMGPVPLGESSAGDGPAGYCSDAFAKAAICPTPDAWMQLSLGNCDPDEHDGLLSHAANCEPCARILADCARAMEGNPSAEETLGIAKLAVARAEWQQRIARELAATHTRNKPSLGSAGNWRRGLWAAGAVAAATVVIGLFLWRQRATTPEHLLAQAYSESRTIELRIPDAAYSALTSSSHTRGTLVDHEAAPLLDARARLARELERTPENAQLLQLRARADLLEEHYDAAADALDRLLASGPVTSELLVDAASAYYQRGLVSGSESDRSTALDYLRRADELAPTDPVVLFNEAIVMEDRGQMMNAVEVWNRYITVERDDRWAAEGKRKLAALEQTLNRLKTHQSRIDRMLSTPQTMDALAGDKQQLAALDEELATLQLHTLTRIAYPLAASDSDRSRGSPCDNKCAAARRLLKAIAASLELQHHDYWLSDLLSPDIDSLPSNIANRYSSALDLLGRATDDNLLAAPVEGAKLAARARAIFLELRSAAGTQLAGRAGEERAGIEHLYGLQRNVDFAGCRLYASQTLRQPAAVQTRSRYPWIEAQEEVTEKICDDTPETRVAGRVLESQALQLCEATHYALMLARAQTRVSDDADLEGDFESSERVALETLKGLYRMDSPPMRVFQTYYSISSDAEASPFAHLRQAGMRETVQIAAVPGAGGYLSEARMELANADIQIGAVGEAAEQLRLAYEESNHLVDGKLQHVDLNQSQIQLARSELERGDSRAASQLLDLAAPQFQNQSDSWAIRMYTATRGQLDLAQGHLDQAADAIKTDILSSEGRHVSGGDQATVAEYAQLDHDLYAELAATWLAQGHSASSVLALWERFRLRSRGLPITQCAGQSLSCDEPELIAAQHKLGDSILTGQILLLDRVLVYRMDRDRITWSQKPLRRRDVLDTAQILERAVSSPRTTLSTANLLGKRLAEGLLPALPPTMNPGATLLVEPDPELANLSLVVLPTYAGPLGLAYPLSDSQSILVAAGNSKDQNLTVSPTGNAARPLVIGASIASGNEPPLPEASEEAQSVSRFLKSPQVLLGKDATRAQVESQLGTAAVLHFAGHAVQSPTGTELLLAAQPNNAKPWIDGAFLRQHPPSACRLAVLSACATGQREAEWNHPVQDIVETLGSLGVPEVVATHWQVDSEAAVPLMNAFYQNLAQGSSVAMALTSARRVLSSQVQYNNPYYWGAYYATGLGTANSRGSLRASLQNHP